MKFLRKKYREKIQENKNNKIKNYNKEQILN